MRVGLLECDDVSGRVPGMRGGYREMFAALLPGFHFSYYEVHRGRFPVAPQECDAWLCTGSQYSVYEKLDWIDALSDFIKRIKESQRRFVGVCFGHQMLAHALGGEVAKASQGWGVGVHRVDVLRQEPWMEPALKEVRIPHMHQDQVQRLPPDGVVLGRSDHCEVGMFRVGDSMLGIEGHPEFTAAYNKGLICIRRERIGEKRAQEALASLGQPSDGATVAKWIARFIRR